MKTNRFFVVAALAIAFLTAACGGNGGGKTPVTDPNPPGWTFTVSSGTPEVDKNVTFSTSVTASFTLTGTCGDLTVNGDSRSGNLKLTRSGSCALLATAEGTTKTHTLNVVENPKVTFSENLPIEMTVGQSVALTYTLTGVNPDNRNLVWTVYPSDAGTVDVDTTVEPNTVQFTARKETDSMVIINAEVGDTWRTQAGQLTTTKITRTPMQTLDLGNGQITAGANIGAQNVVAVWNGNNSTSQTTFYVVSNDLEVKFTTSSVAGIFKHCEVYSNRVYCGGSTSAVDLNSDSSKSAIFAVINPSNGQIENQWQFKVDSQATELADFLIRSNGRIFAATNGKKCVDGTSCARMTEFNSSGSEVSNWWMSPAPDSLPVVAIADFEGSIWAGFSLKIPDSEGYAKYAVFSYNGAYQSDGGNVGLGIGNWTAGILNFLQVVDGGIYQASTTYGTAIGLGTDAVVINRGYYLLEVGFRGISLKVGGFFQGTVNSRSIFVMAGGNSSSQTGWIVWGYPDSLVKIEGSSITDVDFYALSDTGYNSVPELSDITGGATASDGILLWGYKDGKAWIVKVPYPLIPVEPFE